MANHSPNTSEYSKPHESEGEPKTHVDQYHYDESGKHDTRLDNDHITDPGPVQMGQETYEWHQSQKDDDDDDADSDDGSSSGK
ncbi:MAG: hypothetical protein V4690_00885 [Patescibacteria group bacterium]